MSKVEYQIKLTKINNILDVQNAPNPPISDVTMANTPHMITATIIALISSLRVNAPNSTRLNRFIISSCLSTSLSRRSATTIAPTPSSWKHTRTIIPEMTYTCMWYILYIRSATTIASTPSSYNYTGNDVCMWYMLYIRSATTIASTRILVRTIIPEMIHHVIYVQF